MHCRVVSHQHQRGTQSSPVPWFGPCDSRDQEGQRVQSRAGLPGAVGTEVPSHYIKHESLEGSLPCPAPSKGR